MELAGRGSYNGLDCGPGERWRPMAIPPHPPDRTDGPSFTAVGFVGVGANFLLFGLWFTQLIAQGGAEWGTVAEFRTRFLVAGLIAIAVGIGWMRRRRHA